MIHNGAVGRPGRGVERQATRGASRRAVADKGRGMPEVTISLEGHEEELAVFGSRDQYLRQIRDALGVKVLARHGEVRVEGDADRVGAGATGLRGAAGPVPAAADDQCRRCGRRDRVSDRADGAGDPAGPVAIRDGNRVVRPRTRRARSATCDRCATTSSCSASGRPGRARPTWRWPMAVAALRRGQIKKIVLVRPAVEAGEHLGFLPGDLEAKINPYLRPLARRAPRPDGLRSDPPLHGQRPDRDRPAGLHAGPDAERRGDHPRRGAERDGAADEDVPDPHGAERPDRGHGRHHAGRPAARRPSAAWPTRWSGSGRSRASAWSCSTSPTSSGTPWCRPSSTRTKAADPRRETGPDAGREARPPPAAASSPTDPPPRTALPPRDATARRRSIGLTVAEVAPKSARSHPGAVERGSPRR